MSARDNLAELHRPMDCTAVGNCNQPAPRRRRARSTDLELADQIERCFMSRFGDVPGEAAAQLARMRRGE